MSDLNGTKTPKRFLPWIIAGGVAVIALIVGLSIYGTNQGVISDGNKLETQLSAQYADGANALSSCVVQTEQAAAVANASAEAVSKVMADAISGRQYTKPNGSVDQGALINALMVTEAYPDTTELQKTFQQAMAKMNGCRDDYQAKQTVVQASVNQFNSWRTGSWTVRTFGGDSFPNENLYVHISGLRITGKDAMDRISVPIVDTLTNDTYKSGTFTVTNPFGTSK
jgi:hypothetical protein